MGLDPLLEIAEARWASGFAARSSLRRSQLAALTPS
jgi:hypothetical protein